MIDPAGDARDTGRTIGNNFERSITLQYAQSLAQELKHNHHIKTVITRAPAELVPELQNANYANRLHVDLFVSFHFCPTEKPKPTVWLYRYAQANDFVQLHNTLAFYSYDQAYLFNNAITTSWATNIAQLLEQEQLFATRGPFKLPFKPLVGIIAPAIAFEIELKQEQDWQQYVQPIAHAIIQTLHNHGVIQ